MKTIITALGDEWIVEDEKATSSKSRRVFGYSEELEMVLEAASNDKDSSEALRALDNAPLNYDKTCVLIQDKDHPGWSRPVSFEKPVLDFGTVDYFWGATLVKTNDHSIAVSESVIEPGNLYGDWEVMKFIPHEKAYGLMKSCDSLEQCESFIAEGNLPQPLPHLNTTDSRIIDLPFDCKAEVIRTQSTINDTTFHEFETHVTDQSGNLCMSLRTDLTTLLELRDNVSFFQKMLDEHGTKQVNKEVMAFKQIDLHTPNNLEELNETIKNLTQNTAMKFQTADKQYEMLVSWLPLNSIRSVSGKKLYAGEEIPPTHLFDNWHEPTVTSGKERGYVIQVKKAEGVLVEAVHRIPLDTEKLFALVTDKAALAPMLKFTEERKPNYLDSFSKNLLIGASLQGTHHHVEYLSKHVVTVKEMQKRIENQYRRAEDNFLKMNLD
jgi:hypothetical protein